MNTVATFPRAIFVTSMAIVSISVVLLAFVRLPKEHRGRAFGPTRNHSSDGDVEDRPEADVEVVGARLGREETLVDIGGGGSTAS
jgi:hypothetical protein